MKRNKEQDYEICIKLTIPFAVNVSATDKKKAQGFAEGLIADFLNIKSWEGSHKMFESGMVDQWGEIASKVVFSSIYKNRPKIINKDKQKEIEG